MSVRPLVALACLAVFPGWPHVKADEPSPKIPSKEILIGIEYAMPGPAKTFADLGVPAVKPYPDAVPWDEMQRSKDAAIDFSKMDRFVREYQDAGFTELVLVLKAKNSWASKDPKKNFAPKTEFVPHYMAWVKAVVERYNLGNKNAMPGLKRSVRYFEVGSEFSSFEPTPVDDYLAKLERAYKAAHAASPNVIVLHAAFLVTTAFVDHPPPDKVEAAFAAAAKRATGRIFEKNLADIRKVLDRPDIFDAVNFHSLGDNYEIEDTVAWLRYEMKQRKYRKPLIISDTTPNPLIAWGPATIAKGLPNFMGILTTPATEKDRPQLADYFTKLVDGDKETVTWTHSFVAADMVKKVVVAAEQGVALINTSFMEDLTLFKSKALAAGAGTSAWAGMADTKLNPFTQTRTIQELRPVFYAIQQFQRSIKGYESVQRVRMTDPRIRLYKFVRGKYSVWIAWLEPSKVILPGDAVPAITLSLKMVVKAAKAEAMIDRAGQTKADQEIVPIKSGVAEIKLTPRPVFIFDGE